MILLGPYATDTAPIIPPIKAWEELEGSPQNHVIRFQAMAPMSAATIRLIERLVTFVSKVEISIIFFPIVWATAVPKRKGPINSQVAAIRSAFLGESAPVVIMVATTLDASWNPLE